MLKFERIVKKIPMFFLTIVLIGTILYVGLYYFTAKEVKQELAKIKDSGSSFVLADFATPSVLDEENAYLLYKKAFDRADTGQGKEKALWGRLNASFSQNDFIKHKSILVSLIERNKAVFELLEKAASLKKSRIPFRYDQNVIDDIDPIRMGNAGRLMGLLSSKALLEYENDRIDDSIRTCQIGLHFANILYQEPFLIVQLVRLAYQETMYDTLRIIFKKGQASKDSYELILDEINAYEPDAPLASAFEMERLFLMEAAKRVIGGDQQFYKESICEFSLTKKIMMRMYISWPMRPLYNKNMAYSSGLWRKTIELYRLPYVQFKEKEQLLKLKIANPPWHYRIINRFFPPFVGLGNNRYRVEAERRGCQIFLAVMLYRDKQGIYPDFLGQLSGQIIKVLPKDPFSGENFMYSQDTNSFVVYSVGENLKDEKGEGDDIAWKSTMESNILNIGNIQESSEKLNDLYGFFLKSFTETETCKDISAIFKKIKVGTPVDVFQRTAESRNLKGGICVSIVPSEEICKQAGVSYVSRVDYEFKKQFLFLHDNQTVIRIFYREVTFDKPGNFENLSKFKKFGIEPVGPLILKNSPTLY